MIRPATLDDIDAILRLGEELHAESVYRAMPFVPEKVRVLMAALIGGAGVVFVTTTAEGEVVGGIAGTVQPYWFNDELHGFEYSFFIDQAHRGGTRALRVLCAFEAWCRAKGAHEVRIGITTGINVAGTARFYEFAGYRREGLLFIKDLRDGNR